MVSKHRWSLYNETVSTWLNLITTPNYRKMHDWGGRNEHDCKELNWIGGGGAAQIYEVQLNAWTFLCLLQ